MIEYGSVKDALIEGQKMSRYNFNNTRIKSLKKFVHFYVRKININKRYLYLSNRGRLDSI